jgi:hypothetical protein
MPIGSGSPSAPPAAVLAGLCLAALAGCAHQQAENPALSQYPGIQAQIESFYQGSRMSLGGDDLEHVGVVPGGLLAPAA